MDIDQLKRFLAAAELGSITKAARALHLTQPTMTQSIKALEASLGAEVFTRGANGITLTPVGRMLLSRAQSIVNESTRVFEDLNTMRAKHGGRLRIGVAPYLAESEFPRTLAGFLREMPDVEASVTVAYSTELIAQLKRSEIDLALVAHRDDYAQDPILEFESRLTMRYVLVARSGHPIFDRTPYSDAYLADVRWAVVDLPIIELRMQGFFASIGIERTLNPIRTNSESFMKSLAVQTDVIALLTEDYVSDEIARKKLRVLTQSAFGYDTEAGVLFRRDATRTAAFRKIISLLGRPSMPP